MIGLKEKIDIIDKAIQKIDGLNKEVSILKKKNDQQFQDLQWLQALEEAGVDNWEGIDFAHELLEEMNE